MATTYVPEAGHDPMDPHSPSIEEENSTPDPPMAAPHMDMELTGSNEVDRDNYHEDDIELDADIAGNAIEEYGEEEEEEVEKAVDDDEGEEVVEEIEEGEEEKGQPVDENEVDQNDDSDDDLESLLSEVDEAQFDDFDPNTVQLGSRAIHIDESALRTIGVHKRKRAADGSADADMDNDQDYTGEKRIKKKREGKRQKTKRHRNKKTDTGTDGVDPNDPDYAAAADDNALATEGSGKGRKSKAEIDESTLSPEERRRRALDRAMDEAMRGNKNRRRKVDGVDLDAMADEEIQDMRNQMTLAARDDRACSVRGEIATYKLKLLPKVVALLSRNTIADQLVDPDHNLLQGVVYFLEPLYDGSLPAYNIQIELFRCLLKLPITKEALKASRIGAVIKFYLKSKKPEVEIKNMAQKLHDTWDRLIVGRSGDYRARAAAAAAYNANRNAHAPKVKILLEHGLPTFTIAPQSQLTGIPRTPNAGDAIVRKMKARQAGR